MYSKRKHANKKGIRVETLLIGSAGKRKQLDWKRKLLCLFLFLCSQIPAAKIRIASLQFQLASNLVAMLRKDLSVGNTSK